jgi:tetratricopeptide (TPR) repeat protein
MSSLIEGYNYDIFISYRQKDNKGDRWVSEFVEALKTELESTFKEEISVYFDINPSDYLLESYDVDASLKEKLRCLVFIPIISRTYCDPKSFAWEYEFKPFVEQASQDKFGLKVKLPNGNVANRVLPVRIHDLDTADIKECESVLGGVLRGIDFIYKEAGIDKPLTPGDDEKKNINNTKYRIQLIKVAHAIKEIILGLKAEPLPEIIEKDQPKESINEIDDGGSKIEGAKSGLSSVHKLISVVAFIALLIVAGIVTYPKIFKRDTIEKLRLSGERISIAVMPFQNLTNDSINWNVYQEIIQNSLTSYLSNYPEDLQVRQTESINNLLNSKGRMNYASITPSIAGKISQKLDADIFIYGNIIKSGDVIRISAQLKDTKTEEIIKAFNIEGHSSEQNFLPKIDSLSRVVKNYLVISRLEKKRGKEQTDDIFYQVSTNSLEAYNYLIYGMNAPDWKTANDWFKKAISFDSSFVLPYVLITWNYTQSGKSGNTAAYDSAKKWCLKIYDKRDKVPLIQQLMIKSEYAFLFESQVEQSKYLMQILNIDDQQPITYYMLGINYMEMTEYGKAIQVLKKGIEVYEKWDAKPSAFFPFYDELFLVYHRSGQYEEEKRLLQKAQKELPDYDFSYRNALLSFRDGDTIKGNRYVDEYLSVQKKNSSSEANIVANLGSLYSEAGMSEKAMEYCRKLLSLKSASVGDLNNLAWSMLIDDRTVNEVMELAERVLAQSPENYTALHRKGWALYKLGKYEEALKLLQKSWDLRINRAVYNHESYLHLEAAKKAVAGMN